MKIDCANIILFHPGKTGGTSVEHSLCKQYFPNVKLNDILINRQCNRDLMFGLDKQYQLFLQHADYRLYDILNIPIQSYKKLCTVRRPYERILSCYFYNGKDKKYSFQEFITNHLEKHIVNSQRRGYSKGHFGQQYHYYRCADHIIKLENIEEDCKAMGIDLKFHYSKTKGTKKYNNYLDAYTQKTRDIVYNLYKEDFTELGYDK
mgnify:CR=1 FL=1